MSSAAPAVANIFSALQQGQLQLAERLAREQLRADPAHVDVLVLLGLSLQMQGRPAEAIASFEDLTRLQPGAALHWSNLGTVLREAGRGEDSEAAYKRALELAP